MCRMQDEICLREATNVFEELDPSYFTDVNNILYKLELLNIYCKG